MRLSLARSLALVALLAGGCLSLPGTVRAQGNNPDPTNINLTNHGGPTIGNVKVVTIFWGAGWQAATGVISSADVDYFNNFFQLLFADGSFMANLAQYSANGFKIGNG